MKIDYSKSALPKKKRKLLKIPKLRDKAFRIFSLYIRLSVADENGIVKCVTCGKWVKAVWVKDEGPKECEAGHFRHGKDRECYFDERNVNPQCVDCNHYHKITAMQRYTIFLVEKHGLEVVKFLLESKKVIWKRDYLEGIIETYKQKLKMLEEG